MLIVLPPRWPGARGCSGPTPGRHAAGRAGMLRPRGPPARAWPGGGRRGRVAGSPEGGGRPLASPTGRGCPGDGGWGRGGVGCRGAHLLAAHGLEGDGVDLGLGVVVEDRAARLDVAHLPDRVPELLHLLPQPRAPPPAPPGRRRARHPLLLLVLLSLSQGALSCRRPGWTVMMLLRSDTVGSTRTGRVVVRLRARHLLLLLLCCSSSLARSFVLQADTVGSTGPGRVVVVRLRAHRSTTASSPSSSSLLLLCCFCKELSLLQEAWLDRVVGHGCFDGTRAGGGGAAAGPPVHDRHTLAAGLPAAQIPAPHEARNRPGARNGLGTRPAGVRGRGRGRRGHNNILQGGFPDTRPAETTTESGDDFLPFLPDSPPW